MDLNFSAFREPRGVMRVLQFIFSICAFATITEYSGSVDITCGNVTVKNPFDYPFRIYYEKIEVQNCKTKIVGGYSSDAEYFVATGVLAMLFSLGIAFVYVKFDQKYRSNTNVPLIDFFITVVFGVLWLSSSAAWANGLSGVKSITNPDIIINGIKDCAACNVSTTSYSTLNISVIFGFLNFFLWAADLWFLYKETIWFQGNQQQSTIGV